MDVLVEIAEGRLTVVDAIGLPEAKFLTLEQLVLASKGYGPRRMRTVLAETVGIAPWLEARHVEPAQIERLAAAL